MEKMVYVDSEVVAHALLRDTKNVFRSGFEKQICAKSATGDQFILRFVVLCSDRQNSLILIDSFVGHHHRVWIWPENETNRVERNAMYKSIVELL